MNRLHLLIRVFDVLQDLEPKVFSLVREVILDCPLKLLEHRVSLFAVHINGILLLHERHILELLGHNEAQRGAGSCDSSSSSDPVNIVFHRTREVILNNP